MRSTASPAVKRHSSGGTGRINLFLLVVFLMLSLVIYRLFNLTFVRHEALVKTAKLQYEAPSALIAGRGNIYFSDYSQKPSTRKIAAINKTGIYLWANPKAITEPPAEVAAKLAAVTGLEAATLTTALASENKSYLVLATNLDVTKAAAVKKLKLAGIGTASQIDRYYPGGSLAAAALGFVGYNGRERRGQYGVEAFYDALLAGEKKTQTWQGNASYSRILQWFKLGQRSDPPVSAQADETNPASEGSDLVLTIDQNIQQLVEEKLEALLKRWDAPGGAIVIEDPQTGEILAMAARPTFNGNRYFEHPLKDLLNPTVQEIYEPGSSFKPITLAAAIDAGAVRPNTSYNDTGEFKVAGYTIKNFDEKANGRQTMRQVLQHSLNTGAIFAQQKTGDDTFLNYIVSFGLGQKTGVDVSGEVAGNISNLYTGRQINFATASFGQGIAVTPLQLVNAYAAIANGGKLMWPHLVKEIVYSDGSKKEIKPRIIGSPISEQTAAQMKSMLVDVVEKGFDRARVTGYDVAGKTGTAQIPAPSGGYLEDDQFIHNFVGFAPAYAPRFVILIKMDRPKGIKFAADSLSPVFGDITRHLIRYFNIPPTR